MPVTQAFLTQAAIDELFDRIDTASPTIFFPSTPANHTRFNQLLTGAGTVDAAVKGTF